VSKAGLQAIAGGADPKELLRNKQMYLEQQKFDSLAEQAEAELQELRANMGNNSLESSAFGHLSTIQREPGAGDTILGAMASLTTMTSQGDGKENGENGNNTTNTAEGGAGGDNGDETFNLGSSLGQTGLGIYEDTGASDAGEGDGDGKDGEGKEGQDDDSGKKPEEEEEQKAPPQYIPRCKEKINTMEDQK
jgi:hypothetical protein